MRGRALLVKEIPSLADIGQDGHGYGFIRWMVSVRISSAPVCASRVA
jgi:hypothetical protein